MFYKIIMFSYHISSQWKDYFVHDSVITVRHRHHNLPQSSNVRLTSESKHKNSVTDDDKLLINYNVLFTAVGSSTYMSIVEFCYDLPNTCNY